MSINWSQRGSVLIPASITTGGEFGSGVSISKNGQVLAVAEIYNSGGGTNRGRLRTFDLVSNAWVERGYVINGDADNDNLWQCALDSDGSTLAIGCYALSGAANGYVKIFDWSGSAWVQRGTTQAGAANDRHSVVSLSSDGNTVVIGAPGYNSSTGRVQILDWSGSAWVQRGSYLEYGTGSATGDSFGAVVSLSGDGNVLAVYGKNKTRFYDRNVNSWTLRTHEIAVPGACCLNDVGDIVAIRDANNSQIIVYKFASGIWNNVGGSIVGTDTISTDQFGASVSLSGDASTLVAGARSWEGTLTDQGGVYTFNLSDIVISNPLPQMSLYDSIVINDSPIAFWKLDEASGTVLTDSSGNGHHLNLLSPSGTSYRATGPNSLEVPYALSLGSGTYAETVDNCSFFDGGDCTIEWFEKGSVNAYGAIISRRISPTSYAKILNGPNSTYSHLAYYEIYSTSLSSVTTGLTRVQRDTFDNGWCHFLIVRKGLDIYHYVNGVCVKRNNWNVAQQIPLGKGVPPTVPLMLFASKNNTTGTVEYNLVNTISKVSIYDKALSNDDVAKRVSAVFNNYVARLGRLDVLGLVHASLTGPILNPTSSHYGIGTSQPLPTFGSLNSGQSIPTASSLFSESNSRSIDFAANTGEAIWADLLSNTDNVAPVGYRYDPFTDGCTWIVRFKAPTGNGNSRCVVSQDDGYKKWAIVVVSSGLLTFTYMVSGPTTISVSSGVTLTPGSSVFVALRCNGGNNFDLFVNGTKVVLGALTPTPLFPNVGSTNNKFSIGYDYVSGAGGGNMFDEKIEDIAIFGLPLSDTEINALYLNEPVLFLLSDVSALSSEMYINEQYTFLFTFNSALNSSTIQTTDFGNEGTATIQIDSVSLFDSKTVKVVITPLLPGTIRMRVNAGATIQTSGGTSLLTGTALLDNDTYTVTSINPRWLRMFQHLLPNARAWRLTVEKNLRKFFQGLSNFNNDVRLFIDDVYLDLFPKSTRQLSEWEKQFNIVSGLSVTELQRRDRLAAEWQALGGQTPAYLQAVLQRAGFPVYVFDWWEPSSTVHGTARNPVTYVISPSYILKEGAATELPDYIAQCGVAIFQCGEAAAQLGYYEDFEYTPIYIDPASINPAKYSGLMYIGAQTFPNRASIPLARQAEFEALVLKICPAHLYKALLVQYT